MISVTQKNLKEEFGCCAIIGGEFCDDAYCQLMAVYYPGTAFKTNTSLFGLIFIFNGLL
jgi:hypothetical protein